MKNKSNKILILQFYIRLYNSFFKGILSFELLWNDINNFFFLRLQQKFQKISFLKLFKLLKYSTLDQLNALIEITGIQTKKATFVNNLIYNLLSVRFNYRFTLMFILDKPYQKVPSLCNIFYSSVWLEREVWDLCGVLFLKHPDLRRILTDYGFKGHPLQKSFPLVGFVDSVYSDTCKRVIYIPIELLQAPRVFSQKIY